MATLKRGRGRSPTRSRAAASSASRTGRCARPASSGSSRRRSRRSSRRPASCARRDIAALPAGLATPGRALLGALWFEERTIYVDLSQPEPRRRFTDAHEAMHALCPWHEATLREDTEAELFRATRAAIEAEANYGAARADLPGPGVPRAARGDARRPRVGAQRSPPSTGPRCARRCTSSQRITPARSRCSSSSRFPDPEAACASGARSPRPRTGAARPWAAGDREGHAAARADRGRPRLPGRPADGDPARRRPVRGGRALQPALLPRPPLRASARTPRGVTMRPAA